MAMIAAGVLVTACAATIAFSRNDLNTVIKGTADGLYSLTIDSPLYTGSGTSGEGYTYVQTAGGGNVKIKYSGLMPYYEDRSSSDDGVNNFDINSYIEVVSNNDIKGIAGISSVVIKCTSNLDTSQIRVYYGWDEGVMTNFLQEAVVITPGTYTFNIDGSPSYLRISTDYYIQGRNFSIAVDEITINYSCAAAVEPYVTGDYVLDLKTDHFEVTRYKGTSVNLTIPSSFGDGDYQITAIADNFTADIGRNRIKTVSLPSSITRIGFEAFYQDYYDNAVLDTINLGNSWDIDIGERAFLNCAKLGNGDNFRINSSSIGRSSFCQTGLSSVTIGSNSGEVVIGSRAFGTNESLTSVEFDANVTLVVAGYGTFDNCKQLQTVTLPTTIRDGYGNNSLIDDMFTGCSISNLIYSGTTDQWNAIAKPNGWNSGITATVVRCNNGNVPIN